MILLERICYFRYVKIQLVFVVKHLFLKKIHYVSLKLKVVINLVYMGKTATFHVPSTVKTAFVTFKTDPVLVVNPDGRDNPVVQVRYYFTVQYS